MKRVMTVFAVCALSLSALTAATPYAEILSAAMTNSPAMQNNELTYQNSLLTQQQNELDDVVKVTVSSGTVSVLPADNTVTSLTDTLRPFSSVNSQIASLVESGVLDSYQTERTNADFTMTPSVEVVLPNDGSTTITASTGLGFEYGDGSYYSVSPSVGVSHTFDLTGYDTDLQSTLSNARASLESERTYQNARLTFENQVLSSIKAILQAEQSLDKARYELEKAQKDLDNALALGNMSQDSVSYLQTVNSINLQQRTIDATQKQIETASAQYTTLTGLVWDGVDSLPQPDLTLSILPGGNTNVLVADIDVQLAQHAIDTKNHSVNPSSLTVTGAVNSALSDSSKSVSGNAGVTYTAGNWSVSSVLGGSYSNERNRFTPSLTVGGSWTNKTTRRSDDLELQRLNNSLISAQNDLTDARSTYVQDAQNLQIEILNYNYTLQTQAATRDYLEANYEYMQTLYDAGLCTEDQLNDARKELEWADVDDQVNTIDGLVLQNRISLLNL